MKNSAKSDAPYDVRIPDQISDQEPASFSRPNMPDLLHVAIDELVEGFALYDADDRFVFCNRQYRQINESVIEYLVPGIRFADSLRAAIANGLLPESVGKKEQWFAERMERHQNCGEWLEVKREDGRWFTFSHRPTKHGGFVSSWRDITEQKRAQKALEESETLLTQSAAMANLGYAVWDYVSGKYTTVSKEYAGIHGYTKEEFLATFTDVEKNYELIYPEDRERYRVYHEDEDPNNLAPDIEFRIVRHDGEIRHIQQSCEYVYDASGEQTQSLLSIRDITVRKQAEEALQESHAILKAIMDNVPAEVHVKDVDGRYLTINRTLETLIGMSSEQARGKTSRDFFPEELATAFEHSDRHVMETKEAIQEESEELQDDGVHHFLTVKYPMLDSNGVLTGVGGISTDVTVRKQAEEALQESEERYRRAARLTRMGHWVWDEIEDKCIYCSEELAAIYGVSVEEYLRKSSSLESDLEWFHPDDRPHCESVKREAVRNKTGYEITARIVRDDGQVRYIHEVTDGILDSDGNLAQTAGVLHDITERKLAEEALSHQATHDALTGLINRGEFERRVGRVLDTAREGYDEHALCYLDLDQFKVINDTCGHMAGDELLRQLGQLLSETVRRRDTLARLGGDEFGVLMEHCTLAQARRVANKVRRAVAGFRFVWEERVFHIAVSIGLVPITETSASVANVLSAADSACYAAKDEGRNRVHVYHVDDTTLARRRGEMRWVTRIDHALEDQRLQLWSQPIVPVMADSGQGEQFELLLRLVDERGETVLPGVFLPAAERYGLSTKLDRWVVGAALGWLSRSPKLLGRLHLCCINLSGTSLGDEEFLAFVQEQLEQFRIPPQKICFEVTETAAIANLSRAMTFMGALKAQGCRFALDDFGSGLSSFAYLKTLPVDYLKIDGTFVRDIVDDEVDLALVRSINDVGKVMSKRTIAEFVENEAILQKLHEIGVDYAQGYGIGHPAPIG